MPASKTIIKVIGDKIELGLVGQYEGVVVLAKGETISIRDLEEDEHHLARRQVLLIVTTNQPKNGYITVHFDGRENAYYGWVVMPEEDAWQAYLDYERTNG